MLEIVYRYDPEQENEEGRPADAEQALARLTHGNERFARLWEPRDTAESVRQEADGRLSTAQMLALDAEARLLLDVCGACERIKNTLMSISWRAYTRQIILVSLLLLPWGLVEAFGVWTILLSTLMSYVIIGGEAVASYVEEPFGTEEDHLDLEAIAQNIERSVSELLPEGA